MCWHKWIKWQTLRTGKFVDDDDDEVGAYAKQRRDCQKCGKIEVRLYETAQSLKALREELNITF